MNRPRRNGGSWALVFGSALVCLALAPVRPCRGEITIAGNDWDRVWIGGIVDIVTTTDGVKSYFIADIDGPAASQFGEIDLIVTQMPPGETAFPVEIVVRSVTDDNPGFGLANLSLPGEPWIGFYLRDNVKTEARDSSDNFDDDFASTPMVTDEREDSAISGTVRSMTAVFPLQMGLNRIRIDARTARPTGTQPNFDDEAQVFRVTIGPGETRLVAGFGPDGDGDTLSDDVETALATNPGNGDSDGDQLPDDYEVRWGLDPSDDTGDNGAGGDPDADGLTNAEEEALGANPNDDDTDGDGLTDPDEVVLGTDPRRRDTDRDTLSDNAEVTNHNTDPTDVDTDGDGLWDGFEVNNGLDPTSDLGDDGANGDPDGDTLTNIQEQAAGTDADDSDSDNDGLDDGTEILRGTDPNDTDTDDDGLSDGDEVTTHGTDPTLEDTDGDGLRDGYEVNNGLDPTSGIGDDGANGDPDGDTLTNIQEQAAGTDADDSDSDNDGLDDATEILEGTDPNDSDTDNDGLSDNVETGTGVFFDDNDTGTDPLDDDSDDDTMNDGDEVDAGLDPNDGAGVNGPDGDPDADGLTNAEELGYGSDPFDDDSDDDGLLDPDEIIRGTDPNDADSDNDYLPDPVETNTGIYRDLLDTGSDPNNRDTDGDGVLDSVEVIRGSDPNDDDSDGDGLPDAWELRTGLGARDGVGPNGPSGDPDGDGVLNSAELAAGTHPRTGALGGWKEPEGSWDYIYLADPGEDVAGPGGEADRLFNSLDGTWDHENVADEWDGTGPGEGEPGGAAVETLAGLGEGGRDASVLTMVDVVSGGGDDTNRKLFFAHAAQMDYIDSPQDHLRTGLTIIARWRLMPDEDPATDGWQLPDGVDDVDPIPGYEVDGDGKGNIGFFSEVAGSGQSSTSDDRMFAVSWVSETELVVGPETDPDTGDPVHVLEGIDGTAFHAMWITIEDPDEDDIFTVNIYLDGSTIPATFETTLGNGGGDDGYESGAISDISFLFMSLQRTNMKGAIQIDYLGYRGGVVVPEQAEPSGEPEFVRMDVDRDGKLRLSDVIFLLSSYLFGSEKTLHCPDTADANDDGKVGLTDAVYMLSYIFLPEASRPRSFPPFPGCGVDGTADDLNTLSKTGECVYPPVSCP